MWPSQNIWTLHVFASPKRGQTEHSVYLPDSCISKLIIKSDLFPQKTCTGRCQVLISLKRPIRQVAWAIGNTLNDVSQLARPLFSKSQRTFQNEITSSSRSFPQNFQIVNTQIFFLTRIFPYSFRKYYFVVTNLLKINTSIFTV